MEIKSQTDLNKVWYIRRVKGSTEITCSWYHKLPLKVNNPRVLIQG